VKCIKKFNRKQKRKREVLQKREKVITSPLFPGNTKQHFLYSTNVNKNAKDKWHLSPVDDAQSCIKY